jgi:HK97 family phage portal protein
VSALDRFRSLFRRDVAEAAPAVTLAPASSPTRRGFEYAIPDGGLDERNSGGVTGDDRRGLLGQLYDAYRTCPWSWAAVNAIARTITAGGLVTDFTADDDEGDQEVPPKPANVLALERLLAWCNPREDIRQLLRGIIVDLLVFGDAYIEVVWLAGVPVALYSLDAPSMYPIADAHGQVSGYVQVTDMQQRAEFEPHEVIHISLDSPRSGIYGVSPTEAALLPITVWLFTSATVKEIFRKGNPPSIHVDFPASMDTKEINKWVAQYLAKNLGPRNIGTPVPTKGGAQVHELKMGAVAEYLAVLDQKRDEVLATYGVPPAAAGVIESGNLGGGTGEAQDKMFRTNTCGPIAALVLEKIVFAIVQQGFGITDWTLKFKDVDMRDSKTIEEIRDTRIRNGSWTINRARAEIGEPPVDGGDDAVIIDRNTIVLVRDLEASSQAGVAMKLRGTALEPEEPQNGKAVTIIKPEPAPVPDALQAFAGQDSAVPPAGTTPPGDKPTTDTGSAAKDKAKKPAETLAADLRAVDEAWVTRYRQRRRQALLELDPERAA